MQRNRIALGLTAALLWGAGAAPAAEQLVDGIAAQVGTRIVLISEVLRVIGPQEAAMREQGAPEREIAKLRAEALDRLIEARLIEGVVAQLELYAREDEIDATIETIAEENGLTLEQLYASVLFHGMSREDYRNQIKQDLERRNVVQGMVGSDIEIEEHEIRALYDDQFGSMPERTDVVRVRQILVSFGGPSKRTAEEACEIVRDTRSRALEGEDFEVLAREISEVAPSDGGDIGWLERDQLADWMDEAIGPLEPGGISEIVVLPFGCSVLRLEEAREIERLSYEQAKARLHEQLWSLRMEEAYREWMEELRGKTYIDRRGYFADAAQFGTPTFPMAGSEESETQ
jgi:peptidyl-prolyl cis-trans isomerase SurA